MSELEAAAIGLLKSVAEKYNLTSAVELTCPHMRAIAKAIGDEARWAKKEPEISTPEQAAEWFANNTDDETLEGLLIEHEDDDAPVHDDPIAGMRADAKELILDSGDFWDDLWHNWEDGYYDMDSPEEEPLKARIGKAYRILKAYHEE